MPNDISHLQFPSGQSVSRAKQRAKERVRDNQYPSITEALDAIALDELDLPWAKAIPKITAFASRGIVYRMSQKNIVAIMDEWPDLTLSGLRAARDRSLSLKEYLESVPEQRQDLLEAVDQCNKACMYLEHLQQRKTINWGSSTYGLKHSVEHYLRHKKGMGDKYVANGAFICAAIFMGFKVKSIGENGLNGCINFSMQSPVIRWRKLNDLARPLSREIIELDRLEQELGIPASPKVASHQAFLSWKAHKSA